MLFTDIADAIVSEEGASVLEVDAFGEAGVDCGPPPAADKTLDHGVPEEYVAADERVLDTDRIGEHDLVAIGLVQTLVGLGALIVHVEVSVRVSRWLSRAHRRRRWQQRRCGRVVGVVVGRQRGGLGQPRLAHVLCAVCDAVALDRLGGRARHGQRLLALRCRDRHLHAT